jgi:hypothetical protein
VLDIRWTVSFHRAGLRERFIFPEPMGRCPRKLLGGKSFQGNGDVRRYRTRWSGWWIDYDETRAKEEDNGFPPAALFTGPKLLIAQNARRVIATLDRDDYVCKDTFLAGKPLAAAPPLPYLLGLLNSAVLSFLYNTLFHATHVGGRYMHYLSCYLDDLPIRLADDPTEIAALAECLLDPSLTDTERRVLDCRMDDLVGALYGLSEAEQTLVREAIPYAWGEDGGKGGRPKKV